MSDHTKADLRKAERELRDSLLDHISAWVDANCTDNIFWAEEYLADATPDRMAEAAWLVFLSSRDGQRFYREQK